MNQHVVEIAVHLGAAWAAGSLIGLERSFHGRPAGFRTHALVCLASALLMVVTAYQWDWLSTTVPMETVRTDPTRIAQGIMTGIGFLGAGVIIHRDRPRVKGLTSAACVWFTACIGIVCGAGQWRLVAVALAIGFLLLLLGGPIERLVRRLADVRPKPGDQDGPSPGPR